MKKEKIELTITEPHLISAKEQNEITKLILSELVTEEEYPLGQFIWTAKNSKGKLIGVLMGSSLYYTTVFMSILVVTKKYRRCGVAGLLIKKAAKTLKAKDYKYYQLSTQINNEEAVDLYERQLGLKLETCYRAEGKICDIKT